MDGAIIFFMVLMAAIVIFTVSALISVTRATGKAAPDKTGSFQQRLIDINKVPDPKGRGTLWTPS